MLRFVHLDRAYNHESQTTFDENVIHRPRERATFNSILHFMFIITLHKVLFM